MKADDQLEFDRQHLWHPYASMSGPANNRLVVGAHGTRLVLHDGRELIDGMSSWWAAIHGYRHPALDAAVSAQRDSFSHVMFGGLTHEPAINLGRRLVDIAPEGLDRVFFADSGSVAVEVALKMAMQYQRGQDQQAQSQRGQYQRGQRGGLGARTHVLTVLGGYHGDTLHPMSVTDPVGGMHTMWRGQLPEQVFAPQPPPRDAPPAAISEWADGFRAVAAEHAATLAGIIVEPILQGAGGMHPYPDACLQVFRQVADEHDLVLIFDEIATGFGRTGRLFASEIVTPDVLCLGKALTGGYLTMAAVLTTGNIASGIDASESGVLMHGPTFMANPLACAVASASIDLLSDGSWAADVARIEHALTEGLAPLRAVESVRDVRTLGAVGVVQLDRAVDVAAATDAAVAAGVWLRPFRDLIYLMPPYVTTDDDLGQLLDGVNAAVMAA